MEFYSGTDTVLQMLIHMFKNNQYLPGSRDTWKTPKIKFTLSNVIIVYLKKSLYERLNLTQR